MGKMTRYQRYENGVWFFLDLKQGTPYDKPINGKTNYEE